MRRIAYIHELAEWPDFRWDGSALSGLLAGVRFKQGRLLGRLSGMGMPLRAEAHVTALTSEVVRTALIEGERLEAEEVRSSVARKLGVKAGGLRPSGQRVDGVVEMMLDATGRHEEALTVERLHRWHRLLFADGRGLAEAQIGAWRTDRLGPMRVVSGPVGRERVHFEAPSAERLEGEVSAFVSWFNGAGVRAGNVDPVIRAGVAHFWFVTIHPYEDGNGRMARAISEMALASSDGTRERCYSMSWQIERERSEYYRRLERQQRADGAGLDVTGWLEWYLGCLGRAIDSAEELLGSVLHKARVWERLRGTDAQHGAVGARQRLVMNRLLDGFKGHLTASKYATMAKCSTDTALRDIEDLLARGVLVKNEGGGRSTSYRVVEPV